MNMAIFKVALGNEGSLEYQLVPTPSVDILSKAVEGLQNEFRSKNFTKVSKNCHVPYIA
jgi:hypothetical protein